jgi:KaiC/GvpD/RAD55 family RecA-like ATPase
MIRSGITPIDAQSGGFVRGRIHLLTGGPGTGKTTACLQFLKEGLKQGDRVALLTAERLDDLSSHARSIGLDLETAIRDGRALLLHYRSEFARHLAWSGLPDVVVTNFRRLLNEVRPVRLVIDPITPFLNAGSVAGPVLAALATTIEDLAATTIVTFPGNVSAGYDLHLESLAQCAALIIELSHGEAGVHRMRILQARSLNAPSAATEFFLRPGIGLNAPDNERTQGRTVAQGRTRVRRGSAAQ